MEDRQTAVYGSNYGYGYLSLATFCAVQETLGRENILLFGKAPQIWIDHSGFCAPDDLCAMLHRHRLTAAAFEPAAYGYSLGYQNDYMQDCSIAYYQNAVRFCAAAGIGVMLMGCNPVFAQPPASYAENVLCALERLLPFAAATGVKILLRWEDGSPVLKLADSGEGETLPAYYMDLGAQNGPIAAAVAALGLPALVLLAEDPALNAEGIAELKRLGFAGPLVSYHLASPETVDPTASGTAEDNPETARILETDRCMGRLGIQALEQAAHL